MRLPPLMTGRRSKSTPMPFIRVNAGGVTLTGTACMPLALHLSMPFCT